jgi:hypothetical protein
MTQISRQSNNLDPGIVGPGNDNNFGIRIGKKRPMTTRRDVPIAAR